MAVRPANDEVRGIGNLRSQSSTVTESFIDGVSVGTADTYDNIDPSTGRTLGDVSRAGEHEVDQAVAPPGGRPSVAARRRRSSAPTSWVASPT